MSGFYDDQLEEDMTGVKPERPNSGRKVLIILFRERPH